MIRRACALAGLLALFLQGSSGGHMLLVEHSRCAEHGELVHSGDAHAHAEHNDTKRAAFDRAPDRDSDQAHEHCTLSADRRDGAPAVLDAKVSNHAAKASESSTPGDDSVVVLSARYRIAPKNSPPA